jgi:hypothetical protein
MKVDRRHGGTNADPGRAPRSARTRGFVDRPPGYWPRIEGGVVIFLALLIVVGGGVIGLWLLATGGWLRKRQLDGQLDDHGSQSRPTHTTLADDAPVIQDPEEIRRRDRLG